MKKMLSRKDDEEKIRFRRLCFWPDYDMINGAEKNCDDAAGEMRTGRQEELQYEDQGYSGSGAADALL